MTNLESKYYLGDGECLEEIPRALPHFVVLSLSEGRFEEFQSYKLIGQL